MKDSVEDFIEDSADYVSESFEGLTDFLKDFAELLKLKKPEALPKTRTTNLYGVSIAVRPAFIFAERVESLLKIIFGFSIAVSAVVASFWGLTALSQLLNILIHSLIGRAIMLVIGFSYFIIGIWKFARLKR